ncbi:uncharacterized protein METZ01_LOCUS104888, partial [marine metagenome]
YLIKAIVGISCECVWMAEGECMPLDCRPHMQLDR